MSKTLIADDVAAIAARMKELALERSVPEPDEDRPVLTEIKVPDEGWHFHDPDSWQGLGFRTGLPAAVWFGLYASAGGIDTAPAIVMMAA